MAYNMYANNYQQAYYPQNNGLIWVQGEAGAKSYLVAPGASVALWDSEAQTVYLKSADAVGMPSMKILDYTIRGETAHKAQNDDLSEFATKDDIVYLRDRIDNLESKIEAQTTEGKK